MSKVLLIIVLPCLLQQWCLGRNEERGMLIQLNDCTCLGYNQMFECTAFGRGLTIWRGSAFSDCQQNEIRLRHSQYDNNQATGECNGGKIVARSVGFSESGSGRYYTSQLSLAVREGLINETIECIYEDVQGTIIDIIGERILDLIQDVPYPPPSNIRVEAIGWSQITFAWDEINSTQCSSIRYVVSTMDCGACPNTTTGTSITCVYTQSDVSIDANHMCMFAVQTEICGYLLGEKSDYVMVHLNNDEPPRFKLKFYYSTKNATVEIVLTEEGILENVDSPPISYTITYTDVSSGSICGSVSIPASSCLNGLCCHTFGEVSSPCSPDGDISIFVFVTSALGDGPLSQPLIFSLKTPRDEPALDGRRGCHMTAELVLPVTAASLGAALVLVSAVSIVMVIKLQKDKTNMGKLIRSMRSSGITVNRGTNIEYENIEIYDQKAVVKTSDIKTNENPAYSTVKDL